jgi:crossover junction endodeoxyribonuclease RuvC
MIVLGVDPGSHATGYGLITTGERLRLQAAGVVRTKASEPLAERLRTIHQAIVAIVQEHSPTALAVESVFNARNARSSLILGHARGVILLAGALQGVSVSEYTPREVKKALTGNGAATKQQVRFMVTRCLGLNVEPPSLDQSDALAVAICHATRARLPRQCQAGGGGCI